MAARTNTTTLIQLCMLSIVFFYLVVQHTPTALALPIWKDSPIRTIIVPYQPNIVHGHPYQFPNLISESRQVLVPNILELVPRFNLNQGDMAMGSQKGAPVNFADGAYPVYYMPSSVNGKFNGKIALLEGVVKE